MTAIAQPATAELVALAAATRPDLDPDVIQQVITGATTAGQPWTVVLVQTVRMLARGEDVRDLRNALADPLGLRPRRTAHDPEETR